MRYALISDIHANVQALDAVLADTDTRGDVDAVYHLGDLVGYASTPNEVVERLRTRAIAGIAGNYDSTVATDYKKPFVFRLFSRVGEEQLFQCRDNTEMTTWLQYLDACAST